jgi:tyrosine-specific transport protein
MIALWLLSMLTGLFVLEVNLTLPSQHSSLSSMTEKTLGIAGKITCWICTLFILYSLLIAYIIGEADIIVNYFRSAQNIDISYTSVAILFTTILGLAVFWSTAAADYANRGLMSVKGLLVIAALALITPHIDISKLTIGKGLLPQVKYIWMAVPIFLGAYGFQFIVPSLRMYVGDDAKKLQWIIIIGVTVPMIVYIWWLASIFGVVALEESKGASVGEFTQLIIAIVNNKWVTSAINGFTIVTMTTAFIGASLGLFDFLADALKRPNNRWGRFQVAMVTFIPPLALAILCPGGFIVALNYIGIPMTILTVALPPLMVYQLRKSSPSQPDSYRVKCGNALLWLTVFIGVSIAILAALCILKVLPGT